MSKTIPRENCPRIAYIVSQYPMLSMIFIIREVLQLKKLGFEIDVVSINAADRNIESLVADEASESNVTYYIKPQGLLAALYSHVRVFISQPFNYLRGWKLVFKLGKVDLNRLAMNFVYLTEALMTGLWMKEKQHAHLHAHLGSQATTVAMFAKEVFGITFSATVHGPDEFYDAAGQYLSEKVIACDFMICISNFARSQLMKLSPYAHWHKFEVSRLGVDPSLFSPQESAGDVEICEMICVGRLCPAKGQHILVEAVGQIVRSGKTNIKLRIVGAGEDELSLKKLIQKLDLGNYVSMDGAVNQDRIRDLYAQADMFVIPSFAEGIPVVLMEAMAMEIPCVTTRITGIPELIRSGEDGILVAPSSVEELAEAILQLLEDKDLRRRIGKNGRKRVVEFYDLAKNVDRLSQIFSHRLEVLGK